VNLPGTLPHTESIDYPRIYPVCTAKLNPIFDLRSSAKTAIISTLAQHYNIIEIHPGTCRSGAQIKQQIGEACSSKRIELGDAKPDNKLFTKSKKRQRRSKQHQQRTHKDNQRTSLILIEHPEIVCQEDTGFYSTISHLFRHSKIPILVTTNHLDEVQEQCYIPESAKILQCKRPSVDYCIYRALLAMACMPAKKMRTIQKLEDGEWIDRLEQIAHECKCDIRQMLLRLSTYDMMSYIHRKETVLDANARTFSRECEGKAKQRDGYHRRQLVIESISPVVVPSSGGDITITYSSNGDNPMAVDVVYVAGMPVPFARHNDNDDNIVRGALRTIRVHIPPMSKHTSTPLSTETKQNAQKKQEDYSIDKCDEVRTKESQLDHVCLYDEEDDNDMSSLSLHRYDAHHVNVAIASRVNGKIYRSDCPLFYPNPTVIKNLRVVNPDLYLQSKVWNVSYEPKLHFAPKQQKAEEAQDDAVLIHNKNHHQSNAVSPSSSQCWVNVSQEQRHEANNERGDDVCTITWNDLKKYIHRSDLAMIDANVDMGGYVSSFYSTLVACFSFN